MRRLLLILVCIYGLTTAYSQVETTFYPNNDAVSASMVRILEKGGQSQIVKMPSFDLNKLLKEDKEMEGEDVPFRFGKGFDVKYTLEDGIWEKVDSGRVWSMTFESSGALSLNFIFDDFFLPYGASLKVVNGQNNILYGPVTPTVVPEKGKFLTDIIPGSSATIFIFEPQDQIGNTRLTIERVVHGYRGIDETEYYGLVGSSHPCNVDISLHPEYSTESNAIGLVMLGNGYEICSGSLLMSTDLSFKPYFLTAFHCLDRNPIDNELSDIEKSAVSNWLFKFFYISTNYTGNPQTTGKTYNGSTFRSAYYTTDFALLEIGHDLTQDGRHVWLGWDKTGNTPSSGACLHHPAGDLMKISIESDPFSTIDFRDGTNNAWYVGFDEGITQYGSSGSPLLDQNKRVVGQLFGGPHPSDTCNWTNRKYGKFHVSWIGANTNSTRLSNWLYPANTGQSTMNSSKAVSIAGSDHIINSSVYYVKNLPGGYSVTWSLSNNYYNQNCLQHNTPTTNQCTIVINSQQAMIGATLIAIIKYNNVFVRTLTKTVGAHVFVGSYYNGQTTKSVSQPYPLYVKRNASLWLQSPNLVGATLSHMGNATVSQWSHNSTTGQLNFSFSSVGTCTLQVTTSDGDQYSIPFASTDNVNVLNIVPGNGQIEVSLVPAGEEEIRDIDYVESVDKSDCGEPLAWTLEVYNAITGEKVYSQKVEGSSFIINTTGWKSGIYIVRAIVNDEILNEKVLVQ